MKLTALLATLALCVIPDCASMPQQEMLTSLPPIPATAMSATGPVPIKFTHDLHCAILRPGTAQLDTIRAWGCYHSNPRLIELNADLSRVEQWLTLRHEIVHSTLHANKLSLADGDLENQIADAMAQQQMGEMIAGWPARWKAP